MALHQHVQRILFSRTLGHVAGLACLAALYAAVCVAIERAVHPGEGGHPPEFHTSLSLVVGLLLVFRTNSAYARWLEARVLWGELVNASRNLAVKLATLGSPPPGQPAEMGRLVVAFAYALRDRLRGDSSGRAPAEFVDAKHPPGMIVRHLYEGLAEWVRSGAISGDELRTFDADAVRLLDVCGGCERILSTRIARSYRRFARQCVLLYLAAQPWGLVSGYGWWTVPLSGVVAYFMIGLEVVAEHVEGPFGYDEDDLDLDALCHTIQRSVEELLPVPADED